MTLRDAIERSMRDLRWPRDPPEDEPGNATARALRAYVMQPVIFEGPIVTDEQAKALIHEELGRMDRKMKAHLDQRLHADGGISDIIRGAKPKPERVRAFPAHRDFNHLALMAKLED